MAMHPVLFLHLCAPNTPNGNPNRLFVAVDVVYGGVLGAWDEGYEGLDAIPDEWKGGGFYGTSDPLVINVSASEKRRFQREGKRQLELAEIRETFR